MALFAPFTASAQAQVAPDGSFSMPLNCTLDRDCWIINLPDAAPYKKALDHRCGFRTYNGHKGTDFAVRDEFTGRKLPAAGWQTGGWIGEAVLQRFVNGRTITRRIKVLLVIK